ncbi:MAG: hypothetical protein AB7O24_09765 [Kofleriaceae bacterium]
MRIGIAIALAILSSAAWATPVANLTEDLDGDGTGAGIELGSDGVLRVRERPKTELKLADRIDHAKLSVARYGGKPVLLVEIATKQKRTAVIIERAAAKWTEATRFEIGGVGLDQDYGIEVEATPTRIYRYQTRGDVRRCDGKTGYLFPEAYAPTFERAGNPAAFRAVTPNLEIDPATAIVRASIDPNPATAPIVYQAKAASTQAGVTNAGGLTIPNELDDGRNDTAWTESLGSDGRGQFFTFEPRINSAGARQIRIVPGRQTSDAELKRSGRPRELAIVTASGSWRVELPDAAKAPLGTAYVIDLPAPVPGCVTVILANTYATGGAPVTAISELGVYADGERTTGGEAMLARVVAEGKDGATTAAAALARRGAAGVAAIDAELARTSDNSARRRLITALIKIKDPAATQSLARAATERWVRGPDLIDLIGALARNGMAQQLHDLAEQSAIELDARVAAASALSPSEPGLPLLIDLAGDGPAPLRRAVIAQLSHAPLDRLLRAAQSTNDAAAAGDLWRATTRHAKTATADRALAVATMTAALDATSDYERRYRLVDGIAALGDAAAIQKLQVMLRALPATAESSALRQVAIRAIAGAPREHAIGLVLAHATDGDPGVRLAVLSALGEASDPSGAWHSSGGADGIDRVIITALTGDRWPDVRRRAAMALGNRCQRLGPAKALGEAVAKDAELDVRRDSLSSLVQCRAAGVAELLARTWDDSEAAIELRAHAVSQAAALGDAKLGATLVGKFTRWRTAAIESAEALVLAQHAATAISALKAQGAAAALMAALDDVAFPEIISAAALGLGALGRECTAAAKVKLQELAGSGEPYAVAARRAAAQCGR